MKQNNLTNDEVIEILKNKVAQTSNYIKYAERDYKKSLAKLEKQKLAIEETKKRITAVKVKAANRMAQLQWLISVRTKQLKNNVLGA